MSLKIYILSSQHCQNIKVCTHFAYSLIHTFKMTTDFDPLKTDNVEIGAIVSRSQICLPYSSRDHPENLYMCVHLRGTKRWQCIDKVSVKNWNMGRKFVKALSKPLTNSWLNSTYFIWKALGCYCCVSCN